MATYLLVWNPNRWFWAELPEVVRQVGRGELLIRRWSCGSNKRIVQGDRVFLMRLGREPRGIFGSGIVVTEPFEDVHWQPEKAQAGRMARYIRFQIDALLDPENEPILWRERLKSEAPFSAAHWDTRSSGIRIADDVAHELEKVWSEMVEQSRSSCHDGRSIDH